MKKQIYRILSIILICTICCCFISCNHSQTFEYDYTNVNFSELSDKNTLYFFQETLEDDLQEYNSNYIVEYVDCTYYSKEYINELYYNSQKNCYFGYDYDEICSYMNNENWCFTVENGETIPSLVISPQNALINTLKKIVAGTGVILICAVISSISAGVGAAPMACFFAGAAKGALTGAIKGALVSGAIGGIVGGIKTKNFQGVIDGALSSLGDGFMWGAIAGALSGGWNSAACFDGDTIIKTNYGYKPISEIEIGDCVYSYNEKSGTYSYCPVSQVYVHNTDELINLEIDNIKIITTYKHPFLTTNGWKEAGALNVGDPILSASNKIIYVDKKYVTNRQTLVYNLKVTYNHTYTITKSDIVVHNTCDSRTLRKNMIQSGDVVPDYPNAAHHIVPIKDGRMADAIEARKILEKFGIDLNAPYNGVFLSTDINVVGTTYHRALHSAAYYKKVCSMLYTAKDKQQVIECLKAIKYALLNGTFI